MPAPRSEKGILSAQTSTLIGAETSVAAATWDAGGCPLWVNSGHGGLFDHFVRQQLHRIWDLEPEHFCRSDIYDQLVFSRQFKRQIARFFAPNNPGSVNSSAAIRLYLARAITQAPARRDKLAI